ncbi:sialate O-acetylesterase-like [Dreissena polymorpha]|uniref:sialate O-acetylesterase-like n=1 Tax=Dreissena polymorpha TaxID=45954 RepID=UPI002264F6A9|nr:sialate O-acetylesterase-like [Dreissena polymorpha]
MAWYKLLMMYILLKNVRPSACHADHNVKVEMMIPDLRPDADGDTVADISTHGLEYVHRLDTHDHNGDKNFSFASYYQNHMVLQGSPKQSIIWGYAPSSAVGQMVTIMIDHVAHNFSVPVMQDQTWAAKLDDMNAGGPHTIQASLSGSVIQLSDVLFGDVWLCSGQSNMQMSMIQVDNSTEEIEDTINYPNIRVFVVSDKISTIPLSDLSSDGGILLPWSLPSPATIGGPPFQYFSAVCWLYGKYLYQHLQKPIGLIDTTWGGTPVEAWSAPEVLEKCGVTLSKPSDNKAASSYDVLSGPTDSSVLWNGMVHPLLNMTIYGAIWYQGESNAAYNRDLYNCTFPGMIDDWRKKFHTASDTDATFPFGFVQLAPFEADYSVSSGFPDIRWHQTADYGYVPNHRLRNVFMAVAMDLPDFLSPYQSIHPRFKQDIAARLTLASLAVAYKQDVSYQGPYPVHVIISREPPYKFTQIVVEYTMGLNQKWLDGYEICCAFTSPPVCQQGQSWWLPTATVQTYNRGNITESYAFQCDLENVVGIRYAWRQTPCPFKNCAIYGVDNNLPMPPFTYHDRGFVKQLIGDGRYKVLIK